jgi:hypothetical protein
MVSFCRGLFFANPILLCSPPAFNPLPPPSPPLDTNESLCSGYGYLNIINATHLHWRFETAVAHVNSTSPFYTDDLTLVVETHGPRTNLPPV